MREWLVRLEGERLDLEEASFHFRTADWEVRQEDDGYYLASADFTSMTESGAVLKRGKQLLKVMNGILKLQCWNYQPVAAHGSVVRVDEAGNRNQYIHVAGAATARARVRAAAVVVKPNGTTELPLQQPTQAASWMAMARRDDKVGSALGLFAEPTLVKLSNILDAIERDVGGERALVDKRWVAQGEIERFTATVNCMEAAGDDARHGPRGFKAPKRPMSLREAQDLFGALLNKWLETKAIDCK